MICTLLFKWYDKIFEQNNIKNLIKFLRKIVSDIPHDWLHLFTFKTALRVIICAHLGHRLEDAKNRLVVFKNRENAVNLVKKKFENNFPIFNELITDNEQIGVLIDRIKGGTNDFANFPISRETRVNDTALLYKTALEHGNNEAFINLRRNGVPFNFSNGFSLFIEEINSNNHYALLDCLKEMGSCKDLGDSRLHALSIVGYGNIDLLDSLGLLNRDSNCFRPLLYCAAYLGRFDIFMYVYRELLPEVISYVEELNENEIISNYALANDNVAIDIYLKILKDENESNHDTTEKLLELFNISNLKEYDIPKHLSFTSQAVINHGL